MIDPTWHSEGCLADKEYKHATVVIYAKRFDDCPLVAQIGDVIRVHRANFREYNGKKQFNVNVQFNSSWALFTTKERHEDDRGNNDSDVEMRNEENQEMDGGQ